MIEQDHFDEDIFEVACDYCSEDIDIDSGGDWTDMISQIKELGWRMRKVDDEWRHMCPTCVKERREF